MAGCANASPSGRSVSCPIDAAVTPASNNPRTRIMGRTHYRRSAEITNQVTEPIRGPMRPAFVSLAFSLVFIARTAFIVNRELYFTLFDDAMISMRYARNLADGHGLIWNAGQAPVEGYTNFLWTLWMALLHLFGAPESKISLLVMLSGAAILVANLSLLRLVAARLAPAARR